MNLKSKSLEELLTQVDEKDNVIGARPRNEFDDGKLIHRSSYLLLLNSQDEILLQQRPLSKKWHPDKWTFSVTGSVLANETYRECIQREIKKAFEKEMDFKELFKYHHFDEVDKAFKTVFLATVDQDDIFLNRNYGVDYAWTNINKVKEEINGNPEKYAPPFVTGMKIVFKKNLLEHL